VNLLPPASCSEWCPETAERVAETLLDWLDERFVTLPHLVLLGKRVARAVCGYSAELLICHVVTLTEQRVTKAIVVPHPSGLNHWWNERENWEIGREAVEEFLG